MIRRLIRHLMWGLGDDAPVLQRYLRWVGLSGVLNGLTLVLLIPALSGILGGDSRRGMVWLAVFGGGVVACWLCRRQVEQAGIAVGIAVLQGMRHRIGNHVATLPVSWFTPETTARLTHLVTQGLMEIAQLPAHVLTPVLSGLMVPVVVAVALCLLSGWMGVLALLGVGIAAVCFWLSARLGSRAEQAFHSSAAALGQRAVEFARSQSVLRAYSAAAPGGRYLETAIEGHQGAVRRRIWLALLSGGLTVWSIQSLFGVLLLGVALALEDGLAPAAAVAVVVALVMVNRLIEPMLDVAGYGEILRGARHHLEAVDEILSARPLPEPAVSAVPGAPSVEVRAVSFRYGPDQPNTLQGVTMTVPPGTMTALVGASGAGKSTLLRLIARFSDVGEGAILVGGCDVRSLSAERLAGQISQIFQDVVLVRGTIAENIRAGNETAPDGAVWEAARMAGLESCLRRMPDGLDTEVGEGGMRLSGGERQRISIARALLKDAPILLVDEATAALDAENQVLVSETLSRLRGQRTLIVIAHQLSTVRMADQIVVLENGRCVESGTPSALEARKGAYARFLEQRRAAAGWRIGRPQ